MLFCKPRPGTSSIYKKPLHGHSYACRSLKVDSDLRIILQWPSLPPSPSFWNQPSLPGDAILLYRCLLKKSVSHAFVLLLDEELICLIDLLQANASELPQRVRTGPHDLLIRITRHCPIADLQPSFALWLEWLYEFPQANKLFSIPALFDHERCKQWELLGFRFCQNIVLSREAVSLFVKER